MDEVNVIDRAALARLLESVDGDQEFLAELLAAFFEDSPKQISAMRSALSHGNADELRRAAHSLKSNSANFGALVLSDQCKELEALAKAGTLGGAAERIDQIEADYAKAVAALQAGAGALG